MKATEAREIMAVAHLTGLPQGEELKPIISYINARITHRAACGYPSIVVYFRQSAAVVEQIADCYRVKGYKIHPHGKGALRIEW